MPANKNKDVEIFVDEANMYHLLLTIKEHDPVRKEYIEKHNVQSFSRVDFKSMKDSGFFKQYDGVEILHDPNDNQVDNDGNIVTADPLDSPEAKAAAEATAKQLGQLRDEYQALYGTAAPMDATVGQLEEWIGDRRAALAKTRIEEIKKELAGVPEADLRKEYKKLKKEDADVSWNVDDLIYAVALLRAERPDAKK